MLQPDRWSVPLFTALLLVVLSASWWWRGKRRRWSGEQHRAALDPQAYRQFPLQSKRVLTHNTRVFRFRLPPTATDLGLPVGRHVVLRVHTADGREVKRPYTPTRSVARGADGEPGYFELLIKIYPEPHGVMGRHLDALVPGAAQVEVRGPTGHFTYQPNRYRELGMIAGGTGITPMWQIIEHAVTEPHDRTRIRLVFANVREEDILMREEIERLAAQYPHQFQYFYVLNEPPAPSWSMGVGFVSADHIRDFIGEPADDKHILMCGPPPMMKAMRAHLEQLGYPEEAVFKF